ncbi:efflux RND transporter permease subunit [Allomuricauda sp. NBRC 101325]|uniref:efflux RND transporter permease subunit n=1 Tax=Allomuricauda sp. NBRC 101325 TaxID=1113758 RepID=UPI0024A5C529|nr:MMPL family transporter [Muricauda sp. NBRC 101325]GLU42647.1 RND transporter [Muricauda sp. NBRC 101325]
MVQILLKYKYSFLLLLIVLTLWAVSLLPSIKINTDFSQFLPGNDPEYVYYQSVKSQLKDDHALLIFGIEHTETIYEKKFLNHVDSFVNDLKSIDGRNNIRSLTNLAYPIKIPMGLVWIPYLDQNQDLQTQKKRVDRDYLFTKNFINEKGNVLFIYFELEEPSNDALVEQTLNSIDSIVNTNENLSIHQWGKTYLQKELNEITKRETQKITLWAFLFLALTLLFIFRKLQAVLYSLILVCISLFLFMGGMVLFNKPFNIMSNLFPTIVLIVGISDIIHLSIKFNHEIKFGHDSKTAFKLALKEISWALFITSFTTAIGFFILRISPMQVLREFGLQAGIAVILTFLITLLLAPTYFSGSRSHQRFLLRTGFSRFTYQLLHYFQRLHEKPKLVFSLTGLLVLVSLFGVFSINTNNIQYSIPKNSDLKSDHTFFENQMGGSRSFEMLLESKNDISLDNPELLRQLEKVHTYLTGIPYLDRVKSPVILYKMMQEAYLPTLKFNTELNLTNEAIEDYNKSINRLSSTNYLMNKERTLFKINAQMKDFGRHEVTAKTKEILENSLQLIDTSKVSLRISGMDHLFDRAHEKRISEMVEGLMLALILVAVVLGFIFKKWSYTLLALLLNLLPIIIGAGILGFTQLELRAGSSIIFTIAFVIAVDDTIHLLSKYQWERKKGASVDVALNTAFAQCGKAIIATTIILLGGFSILMLSSYNEMFTFGLLMTLILVITLLVDLILAPVLIKTLFKKHL